MSIRRYLPFLSLLACAALFAAQPSGGTGSALNDENTLTIARSRNVSPWPEPEAAAVETLTAEIREKLPGFFTKRIGPWIVATDLSEDEAQSFISSTIGKYAADIQRQLFTSSARREPVKVLLFKNKLSYETWTTKLYRSRPDTPYGYYSRTQKALVMNIGTGGGTLLHEMVHAMAEPDFESIPAWLNEGLGSLFEASSRNREGKVIGITNWRLSGLLAALNKETAPKLKDLLIMSDEKFYGEHSGTNYAASRYLMQYLQQQSKLETFYTRIRDKKDRDALATLRFVFDNKLNVDEIETQYYAWVKTLKPQ
ncbi:MAG TPA: DUF1570 domain-containing protein [Planctomycetota bacterium]|jgi:hypothetical protein